MREGDAGDSLFFVAVGRLRVTMTHDDGTEALAGGARTRRGRRRARGDDQRAAFRRRHRAARQPGARALGRGVHRAGRGVSRRAPRDHDRRSCGRLVRSLREGSPTSPVVTIAVVPLSDDPSATEFAARLRDALERLTGAASNVTVSRDDRARSATSRRVGADRLASWFGERELGFEAVVYAADPEPNDWTAACVRQADLVLLVAAARRRAVGAAGRARDRSSAQLGAHPHRTGARAPGAHARSPRHPPRGCAAAPSIAITTCASTATPTSTASRVCCSDAASAWCSVAAARGASPASVC